MGGRECYHCKQWIDDGDAHDCWTTTETALTRDLPEDLRDAWERLRETAAAFGDQRIYASHHCIMFSRTACYCFVRPKRSALELCIFLGRPLNAPQVRRTERSSQRKVANLLHITHRDQVEPPVTDWMREAYEQSETLSGRSSSGKATAPRARKRAGTAAPARRVVKRAVKAGTRSKRSR